MGWYHQPNDMHSIVLDHILLLLTSIASDLDAMLVDLGSDDKPKVMPGVKVTSHNMTWASDTTMAESAVCDTTSVDKSTGRSPRVNGEKAANCVSQRIKETRNIGNGMKDTNMHETICYRTSFIIGEAHKSAFSLSFENARGQRLVSDLSSDGATVSDRNSFRSSDGDFFSAEERSSGTGTYFASSEGDDGPGPPSGGGPFHTPTSSTVAVPKTSSYETPYETPPSTLGTPYSSIDGPRYNKVISLLDRLARTHPIWYLPTVARGAAIHLLQATPEGTFLVRQSSRPDTMALSVRTGPRPEVQHYLIQTTSYGLSLENSEHFFHAIHTLVAHYCSPQRELPVQLILPEAILTAKSYQQLAALSYLGQDFWTLSSKPNANTNGHCKTPVAAVAPYHTGHACFDIPTIMTTTAGPPPLINGMADHDASHQESSINVMITSGLTNTTQAAPSQAVNGSHLPHQSDQDTSPSQAQKNLINALKHSKDTNSYQGHISHDDYVFRPIQTALKELAELGERQRKHHLTTGKKQRNSCYSPGYRPESLVDKQPDRQMRAKSEEKTKQAKLSVSPKKKKVPTATLR